VETDTQQIFNASVNAETTRTAQEYGVYADQPLRKHGGL